MKPGKAITYVDAAGERHTATCSAVVGTGASTCKILDVSVGDEKFADVPHRADAAKGDAYWQLSTDPDPAPTE